MKWGVYGAIFVMLSAFTYAACQYNATETYIAGEREILTGPDGKEVLPLTTVFNSTQNDGYKEDVQVINPNPFAIKAVLSSVVEVRDDPRCDAEPALKVIDIEVGPNGMTKIPVRRTTGSIFCKAFRFTEPFNLTIKQDSNIKLELVDIEETRIVCSGKDDGASCELAGECGGGFCIRNVCTTSENCYNNNCDCAADELQCLQKSCVKREAIPIGQAPTCGMDHECVSNYVDSMTGLCAPIPSAMTEGGIVEKFAQQIVHKDNRPWLLLVLLLAIIAIAVTFRMQRR
ncbi:hypothetical protein H6504_01180 [Candidatus Woesearchaeota archaeon]|nr:hypothetical protein [Candidatus Woesearchaeota archaeon]